MSRINPSLPGLNPFPKDFSSASSSKCPGVKPTCLTIDAPKSRVHPVNPRRYGSGFSRDGRIIGSNQTVPYPSDLPFYHHIPFRRLADWFAPALVGDADKETLERVHTGSGRGGGAEGCQQTLAPENKGRCQQTDRDPGQKTPEDKEGTEGAGKHSDRTRDGSCCRSSYTPSYVVDDDPEYKSWVDGKVAAQIARNKAQAKSRKVPWDIKLLPGHHAPSIPMTTNEVYGLHLDMIPKFPLKYPEVDFEYKPAPLLVRFQRSNMSDHPPIPDHAFAVPHAEMMSQGGRPLRGFFGSPFIPDQGGLGELGESVDPDDVGLRPNRDKAAKKLPTRTKEGTATTVISGAGVKPPAPGMEAVDPWTFRRSAATLGRVVGERRAGFTWPIFSPTGLEINRPVFKTVSMVVGDRHSALAPKEIEVPVNVQGGVYDEDAYKLTRRDYKKLCEPYKRGFVGLSRREPCHRDHINPELLPIPAGWRDNSGCKPGAHPLPCDDPKPLKF